MENLGRGNVNGMELAGIQAAQEHTKNRFESTRPTQQELQLASTDLGFKRVEQMEEHIRKVEHELAPSCALLAHSQKQEQDDQTKMQFLTLCVVPLVLHFVVCLPSAYWQVIMYCSAGGELGIGGQHDVGFGPMRSPHGGIGKLASLGILMMFMTLNFFIEMVAYCLGWERSLLQARKERREKREVQFRSRITGPQGREGDLKPAGPGNSGHNPLQLDLDVRIKALQDKQEQAKSGAKGRE